MVGAIAGVVVWLSLTSGGDDADSARRGAGVVVTLSPDGKIPAPVENDGHAGSVQQHDSKPVPATATTPGLTPPQPHPPTVEKHAEARPATPLPAEPAPAVVVELPKPHESKPPEPMPVEQITAPKKHETPAAVPAPAAAMPPTASPAIAATPRIVGAPAQEVKPRNTIVRPKLPTVQSGPPLSVAPDPALVQRSGLGPLPRIGDDGRMPWRVYARPFDRSDKRPRIAIIVTGLGLSSAATNTAIQSLPGGVTLAFAPYAGRLGEWIRLARAAGHEVLLNVPMEPVNYPEYDPGPQVLLTTLTPVENRDRLLWTLSRATGYVGVIDFMGSKFTNSNRHIRPVLATLKNRGLIFVNSATRRRRVMESAANELEAPWAANTMVIDDRASRSNIDTRLKDLEVVAGNRKRAIGMGSPYPVTLERIALWVRDLEKRGIALAPVSALIDLGDGG